MYIIRDTCVPSLRFLPSSSSLLFAEFCNFNQLIHVSTHIFHCRLLLPPPIVIPSQHLHNQSPPRCHSSRVCGRYGTQQLC